MQPMQRQAPMQPMHLQAPMRSMQNFAHAAHAQETHLTLLDRPDGTLQLGRGITSLKPSWVVHAIFLHE